jgi:DNA-binding CsgD family transcriptional regulator
MSRMPRISFGKIFHSSSPSYTRVQERPMSYPDALPLLDPLTERESDVLRLMTAGRTNDQIAAELVLAVETVRWHVKRIYSKLGVHSRTQAVLRSVELGLVDTPDVTQARRRSTFPPDNLPVYASASVGRETELNDLIDILQDPQVRLVTIAGPGGIGKTRLCVEAARLRRNYFNDGAFFIPLAALKGVAEIAPAIAREIGLRLGSEGHPQEQLVRYLRGKQMLLVLDNFEHLLSGVDLVVRLLAATPRIKILVTSQTSLNLQQEWVRYLEGMRLPSSETAEDFEAYGAVRLFLDRVRHARRDFSPVEHRECVIEICHLLQGVPLAIELAAAWLKTLPCADVTAEIRRGLDFLATPQHDVDPRHHSMRAVFERSWQLLSGEERQMLMRLSLFQGGFSRAAAEQVAGASLQTLAGLIEKSFLTQEPSGRYEIHDLLRQFSAQQLEKQASAPGNPRSKRLMVWSSLVKGDLEKVRELAQSPPQPHEGVPAPAEEAFSLALTGVLAGVKGDYDCCLQLCAAGLALGEKLPDPQDSLTSLFAHLGLAVGTAGLGDYYSTRYHLRPALRQAVILRSPALITLCLPVAAIILADQLEAEQAAELLGLAFSQRSGAPNWMRAWRPVSGLLVDLQAELGVEAYAAAWARGTRLDPEPVAADLFGDAQAAPRPAAPASM